MLFPKSIKLLLYCLKSKQIYKTLSFVFTVYLYIYGFFIYFIFLLFLKFSTDPIAPSRGHGHRFETHRVTRVTPLCVLQCVRSNARCRCCCLEPAAGWAAGVLARQTAGKKTSAKMAEGATSLKGLRAQMGKNSLIYNLFRRSLVF